MRKPDARQSAGIYDCGCDPGLYAVIGTEPGWIHAVNTATGIVTHFDLIRKMPCFSWEINTMYYKQAKPGYCFILTEKGKNCLTERQKAGAAVGECIKGREVSVPMTWYLQKYVIEINYEEGSPNNDQNYV